MKSLIKTAAYLVLSAVTVLPLTAQLTSGDNIFAMAHLAKGTENETSETTGEEPQLILPAAPTEFPKAQMEEAVNDVQFSVEEQNYLDREMVKVCLENTQPVGIEVEEGVNDLPWLN